MSGMFGGGKTSYQSEERLAGVAIQTSCYGGAIALVYGTDRVAVNLIWYAAFTAIPHTSTQKVGKGGGGGSTQVSTTYTYAAAVMLAICEGPATINRVWRDKEIGSLAGYGFTLLNGSRTQSVWSYLTSKYPAQALAYAGTVLVVHPACDLGGSATLKNHSFEVTGFCAVGSGNLDAHPADILPHYLSDPLTGAGWDASRIGNLATWRTYCTAAGLWLSPSWTEQAAAKGHVEEILKATNSEAVWSEGKLKVIPYGDTVITGNGTTYTPNVTPLYDLTLDDFLAGDDEDPVEVERVSPVDAWNCVPVKFRDRALDYNENTLDDPDPVDAEVFGLRKSEAVDLPCIKRASIALTISRILAQRSVYCRNKFKFKLGWRFCLLESMDLVTLTVPYLGLTLKPVRLIDIEENEEGTLSVLAEEWPFGVATHTLYTPQTGDGTAPNVNADPGNATAPIIFEPPAFLRQSGQPEIWMGTSGTPDLWGGCEVHASTDGGASYGMVGSVSAPARYGVTTAPFGAGADPDTSNTLAVDLSTSHGTLTGTDVNGRDSLATLSLVENELVAFQTVALTGSNRYNLTSHRRGAWGTSISAHTAGVRFLRLDEAVFKLPYDASLRGKTIHIKLVSFNVWGGGKQDISAVPVYTFVPVGVTYPQPTNVVITVT